MIVTTIKNGSGFTIYHWETFLNVGTTAGTVAAGNDSRITGAVQSSALPTCSAGQYLTFNGAVWSCAADVIGESVSSLDLGSASATGTLAAARLPAFTGDATTVAGNSAITLANSGVNAGTYAKVTVDAKGRVTSGNALVASDITTALAYTPINRSLANANFYVGNGSSIATAVAMSGDATMAITGAVTLKNTGTAGTYGTSSTAATFTTDAQGRVTAVSENPITISSSRITDFAAVVIGTVLPGLAFTNSAVTSADSILIAIGKLQAQLKTVIGEVTVNGSQAIEIRWNSSTGTATSVGARTMIINRVR